MLKLSPGLHTMLNVRNIGLLKAREINTVSDLLHTGSIKLKQILNIGKTPEQHSSWALFLKRIEGSERARERARDEERFQKRISLFDQNYLAIWEFTFEFKFSFSGWFSLSEKWKIQRWKCDQTLYWFQMFEYVFNCFFLVSFSLQN